MLRKPSPKSMTLETHMRFASRTNHSGVHLEVYRTHDDKLVETMTCSGEDYQNRTLVSITNQIGCPVRCDFCKVSELSLVRNITVAEYLQQVAGVVQNINGVPWFNPAWPVKVSFGRAGEPLLNANTMEAVFALAELYRNAFQLFSVMPGSPTTNKLLEAIMQFVSTYENTFQLNVSMHTTDENKRRLIMPKGKLMSFEEIGRFGELWHKANPKRKIDLSFILMEDVVVDFRAIRDIFDPRFFTIRLAYYLPSSAQTALRHPSSDDSRLVQKAQEARDLGYSCIEARAGPIERIWDSRPYSGFRMLRDDYSL